MKTKLNITKLRQNWLKEWEEKCYENNFYEKGKVNWDTGIFFFLSHKTVEEAIQIMKDRRKNFFY